MKIKVKKSVGDTEFIFEAEGEKPFDGMFLAAFFASTPTKCRLCESEDVTLSSNKAQDYKFVKVKCNKCNARSQVGQYKPDGSGYYWKEWEVYEKPSEKEESSNEKQKAKKEQREESEEEMALDDLPF